MKPASVSTCMASDYYIFGNSPVSGLRKGPRVSRHGHRHRRWSYGSLRLWQPTRCGSQCGAAKRAGYRSGQHQDYWSARKSFHDRPAAELSYGRPNMSVRVVCSYSPTAPGPSGRGLVSRTRPVIGAQVEGTRRLTRIKNI